MSASEHRTPPSAAPRRRARWRVPPPILAIILLDLTFNAWFWRIPKLTQRSADYGYQFLVDVHELSRAKPKERQRVLAFGSSVAGSFDAGQVQSLLRAAHPDLDLEVHRLLVPGIKPSDYRLFFRARGDDIDPDVVVLPLNLADFQNPSVDRGVKPQVRNVLPPWPTLREKWEDLPTAGDKLDLIFAGLSHFYRYRNLLRSAVQDHAKWLARRLRARPTPIWGFYADGYAKRHFAFPAAAFAGGEVEYYVDPEWIRQQGQVHLRAELGGRVVAERELRAPGWQVLRWAPAAKGSLEVATDSAWNPRAGGFGDDVRLLGVRLRPLPPGDLGEGRPPVEYPPFHDRPELLRMGAARGAEFVKRWRRAVGADDEFGRRVRAYRETKTGIRDQEFAVNGEYAALRDLVRDFVARGVAVVLINNPESPLILGDYENTDFYRAYRAFLGALAAGSEKVHFHDIADALAADDFNDWHHITYIGAIELGPRYAAMVEAALPRP